MTRGSLAHVLRAGLLLIFAAAEAFAQVRVRGYVRKDGTYVPPHTRSSPDKSPYNNYSYPGNVNPYTGKVATGDPLTYLERYYGTKPTTASSAVPRIPAAGVRSELPADLVANLSPLPGAVPIEEIDRARVFCRGISSTVPLFDQCLTKQSYALAGLALPDYGPIPRKDLQRVGQACERVYDDDRAGFYDCLNREIVGAAPSVLRRLATIVPSSNDDIAVAVVGAPASEADRASGRRMFDTGMIYFGRQEWAQALESLRKAVRFDGSIASYHAAVGAVEMVLGHWEEAEAEYTAASLIDVDNAEYRNFIKEARGRRP